MSGNTPQTAGSGYVAPANNLRQIREEEGLSKAELARLSRVAPDTVSDAENRRRQIGPVSRNKIVRGLNANPNKLRDYTLDDVFPNG